jgi:hypothetical protein
MLLQSIKDAEIYVQIFPYSKTNISKTKHIRRNIEKYLEEFYILKERLVKFVEDIKDMHNDNLDDNMLICLMGAKFAAKETLKQITGYGKTRGAYVHVKRYAPKDIEQLVHMEEFVRLMKDDEHVSGLIKSQHDLKYNKVRREWAERVNNGYSVIIKTIDQYFSLLRVVVFEDDCTPRLPITD